MKLLELSLRLFSSPAGAFEGRTRFWLLAFLGDVAIQVSDRNTKYSDVKANVNVVGTLVQSKFAWK